MATLPEGVRGLSEEEATKRFTEAMENADQGLRLAAETCVRFEMARAGSRPRERGRLARKYGSDSAAGQRAEAALRVQEAVLDAAVAEVQRARVAVTPLDSETTRVHGRVVDRKNRGIPEIEARLADARGKTVAKATTDENGYFRLEVRARVKPGPAKAGSRRIVTPADTPESPTEEAASAPPSLTGELVLRRGRKELVRELVRDLKPGQSLYLEPVVEKE